MTTAPGMPCTNCNKGPAWVYDLMKPDAQASCFTKDNLTFCGMDTDGRMCGVDTTNCTRIVNCPEQLDVCMAPLRRPKLRVLPLLQLEAAEPASQLVWESQDLNSMVTRLAYSNYLPEDAVKIADKMVHWDGSFPYTPRLPYGFGCPDWPPVMAAMGVQSTWPSNPAATDGANATSNSSSPQRTMCWVDATVAMNLMVGSMLETFFPVQSSAETSGADLRPPYSSALNWTVYWMPPNTLCESPGTQGCMSQTFQFQLEQWVPCDSLPSEVNGTSSLQRLVQGNATNNITTEYYCYNPMLGLRSLNPMYGYNPATFHPDGILGPILYHNNCQQAIGNTSIEDLTENIAITSNAGTVSHVCSPPLPLYPVGDGHLPELLFAMPFSSYDPIGSVLSLQRVAGTNNAAPNLPWCTSSMHSCNDAAGSGGPSTNLGTGTSYHNISDPKSNNYSMPVPPPCQDCKKGPAWTYDVMNVDAPGLCVYNTSMQYCQVVNGTTSCATNTAECNKLVPCPYPDITLCLEPLRHQTHMMPLRQVEGVVAGNSYTEWTSQSTDPGNMPMLLDYSNWLPEEAVRLADKLVHTSKNQPYTPILPYGFGCPDWPPVMEAMGLDIFNTSATDNNTMLNATSSNNTQRSTMCWVDATVAMNVMVGQMLSSYFYCYPFEEDPGRDANLPYSACSAWTVSWLPPNLPCDPTNTASCLNHTFYFQLDRWARCDDIISKVDNTSRLEKWVWKSDDSPVNGTEYCQYDTRYGSKGGYNFNYATFMEQGPLGSTIRAPLCNLTNSSTPDSTSLSCSPPPFYPIGIEQLPEPLFGLPFSSYDAATADAVLRHTDDSPAVQESSLWCPAGVQPCIHYNPPPYVPYFDIYNNGNEGYFQVAYDYNNTSTSGVSYTYIEFNTDVNTDVYTDDYSAFRYFMSPMSWMYDWNCKEGMHDVARLMQGGYVAYSAAGFYEACLDTNTARGNTFDRTIYGVLWNSKASCSSGTDFCCSDVGLKPGNKAVCESHGSCSFSASCTASRDNCYDQFKASLSNVTNYAVCGPNCGFQPLTLVSAGAAFTALPTLRTAANGTIATQQGICYNMTVWDTCTTKTSEATCQLWAGGNNSCSWTPTCKPPAAVTNHFSCVSSTDSCCLDSTTTTFSDDQKASCSGQQGPGGKLCKVERQCYLLLDPCATRLTPWDCLANATCQFSPAEGSRMGGVCRTLLQYDLCAGLEAANCSSTLACTLADRCITDRCPDASDTCCAFAGRDTACCAQPTCLVTSTCLPATAECAVYSNQSDCEGTNFCHWSAMRALLPISTYGSSNMTNSTNTVLINNGTYGSNTTSGSNTSSVFNSSVGSANATQVNGYTTSFKCVMDSSKHPCSMATDAQTCYSMVDAIGRPRCYSQGNCLSACSRCADCLSVLTTSFAPLLAQLNGSAATDANKVSQMFSSWCYSRGLEATMCDSVSLAIALSRSGNLARRPGMLCTLAGRCTTGCSVPVRNASGIVTSKQPLSLCTDTGTAAGTPVPLNVSKGTSCLADGDCKGTGAGAWCDLGSAMKEVCTCVAGKDICSIMGSCNTDVCPRLADLVSMNKDLNACTDSSQCGAGLVCQPKVYQTYTCSNSVVTATNHTGYCAEAAPGLLSAKLDDTAASITVALSAPAAGVVSGCSAIFTSATMAKLGSNAICAVDSQKPELKQLVILLQDLPSMVWGTDKLDIRSNQTTLVSKMGGRPFAGTSATPVASCTNCPAPIAILSGPRLVTKPCIGSDVADFTAVNFDASGSQGSAAAPITDVAWDLVRGSSGGITAALGRLAAKDNVRDKMVLKLDGAVLQNTNADIYSLAITVTNSLGQSSSAMSQFVVADAGSKPSISVFAPGGDASDSVIVQPSAGLKLQSKLQVDSVCKGSASKVNYRWTCTAADSRACTLPAEAAAYKQLMLGPSNLIGFKLDMDYTFILTAAFTGSAVTSTASVMVHLARSPLRAVLVGPTGDLPLTKTFTLDASKSADPDDSAASLKYDFSCSPQPCFSDIMYTGVRAKPSSWTIDASKLAIINQEYTITVTVSGTAAGDTRTASASLSVTPKPGNPPTSLVTRFCGYDANSSPLTCAAKHNPTQDLVVTLKLDNDFKDATVVWVIGGDNKQLLLDGVNAKGVRKNTLTVHPSAFPSAGLAKLQAIMSMPGINGSASISVPLNTPPNCPQPPCFFTDINSTVFPAYTFVGSATGWQDADGDVLVYEFGQVVDGDYKSRDPAGPSTSYVFKGFEPGSYQLYACAIDTIGARTCATASIEVQQPPAVTAEQKTAIVEGSVGKIDVEQLASTGDVSAVTNAMQELASIAAFATTPASSTSNSNTAVAGSSSSGGSTSAGSTAGTGSTVTTTTTTTAAPVLSPVVVEKQNALLTTLSTVMNVKDPAAMGSSMDAADKVSDAGTAGLSEKAGGALLDVVDGFVAANKDSSAAAVTDSQVKTAAKVLSKGLKAAFKTDGSASRRRRALLSLSSGGSAAYTRLTNSLTGLLTLMSAGTPTGSTKVMGSSDICMAVTRDSGVSGGFDGKEVILDCSSTAATTSSSTSSASTANIGQRRRDLKASVQGGVSFIMPTGFSTACAADPVCSQGDSTAISHVYVADPTSVLAMVKDWPAASLVVGADPASQLIAVSGVLTFALGSKASGPICSTASSCMATITLPVAAYNPMRSTACLRLDPLTGDATALLQASTTGVALVPGGSSSSSSVTCTSDSWGKVVVVQYTATRSIVTPATEPPAGSSITGATTTTPAPQTTVEQPQTDTATNTGGTTAVSKASPSPSPPSSPAHSPTPLNTPSPAPSNTSVNASQQPGASENVTYGGLDNSTLAASDVGQPIAFTFTFSNYNYSSMFMSGGSVDTAAVAAFQLAIKQSFLAGAAAKTNMTVVTADNKLQVNRVNILDMRSGSVIIDLEFLPPPKAALPDITSLKSLVSSSTADFFAAPGFIAAYGAPAVTGQSVEQNHTAPAVSQAVALGAGVGVGIGGALLLLGALAVAVKRRRNAMKLRLMAAAGAEPPEGARVRWPVLQGGQGSPCSGQPISVQGATARGEASLDQ